MKKLFVRKWINRRGYQSTGFVFADGTVSKHSSFPSIDCIVKIGDCTRQVELDFNSWGTDSGGERRNNIAKAQLLADFFGDVAEWLREATDEIEDKPRSSNG